MPGSALATLAEELRNERTLVAVHVRTPPQPEAALAPLVAAGPVGRTDPDGYGYVIEAIYEGYLLHYGVPRIFEGQDPDMALLAGDYLYALGLGRLAEIGDREAVAALADLISLSAACHSQGAAVALKPLWLGTAVSVACGDRGEVMAARSGIRLLDSSTVQSLWRDAEDRAERAQIGPAFRQAQNAIDFPAVEGSNLG